MLILPDGTEYGKAGELNFAASQIDPGLGTQQLRATFDNSDHQLLPGQFVRARVITGERSGVFLRVPYRHPTWARAYIRSMTKMKRRYVP